eukprot:1946891-Amphidinium_carterae.1
MLSKNGRLKARFPNLQKRPCRQPEQRLEDASLQRVQQLRHSLSQTLFNKRPKGRLWTSVSRRTAFQTDCSSAK